MQETQVQSLIQEDPHTPQSNEAHEPQLVRRALEPVLHNREAAAARSPRTHLESERVASMCSTRESPPSNGDPAQPKTTNNKIIKNSFTGL